MLLKKEGLRKSSTVTAVKEFIAEDIVLNDPLNMPATNTPGRPGKTLSEFMTK